MSLVFTFINLFQYIFEDYIFQLIISYMFIILVSKMEAISKEIDLTFIFNNTRF